MGAMDKSDVIIILNEIGTMLELKGENVFKSRAYYNAARTLQAVPESLEELASTGKLGELKGFGKALVEKVTTLYETGSLPYYENLRAETPDGLFEILKIPSLGPKKVKTLSEKLEITTLGELEYACFENRLVSLDGFGEKTQQKVLEGITFIKRHRGQFLYATAVKETMDLVETLKDHASVIELSLAGDVRRHMGTIKDVLIVASSESPNTVMKFFTSLPQAAQVIAEGDAKSSIQLPIGLNVDLRVVSRSQYPHLLRHFTGSEEHDAAMRDYAKQRGMKIDEHGLFEAEKELACADERDIFEKIGMGYIEPELRENMGEIEAALEGTLPNLVKYIDLQGVFHVHSNWSDGRNTIEEVARAALDIGWSYIGISDHSKSAFYANGLDEKRVLEQHKEIDMLNQSLEGITILKGIESDVLKDGSLDYDDEVLAQFDFVIASVHSNFGLSEKEQTERIIRAIGNPYVDMLGHPTGRLLLSREPYALDIFEVIRAAGASDTVIEINANPYRLDLDWRLCKFAKQQGVKMCINPDAHSLDGLTNTVFGLHVARKGWLSKEDIFNTFSVEEIAKRRKGQGDKVV